MNTKKREEAANVALGNSLTDLLGKMFEVQAEAIEPNKKLPDISIKKNGIRIVLEAKGDNFKAAAEAASKRWDEIKPPPNIVGAVSYAPPYLRNFDEAVRQGEMIEFALTANRYDDLTTLKRTGGIYDLAQALRRPYSVINPGGDELAEAINRIKGALGVFANANARKHGTLMHWARTLQASFEGEKEEVVLELSAKMAGLILFGAALFQIELADRKDDVKDPAAIVAEADGIVALREHWRYILDNINYVAIFDVAYTIASRVAIDDMTMIIKTAHAFRHIARDGIDIMGRIYHKLLADAKPLGAFYTSIPAATMMAGLALNPKNWKDTDWADCDEVAKLRIADPACGSGTLLAAASWQVLDNFSRAHFQKHGGRFGGVKREHPRSRLQSLLIEDVVWGYDVLETAVHLSAVALGMMSPETDFAKAHIYQTIVGNTYAGAKAGSLEMMETNRPFFSRDKQVETKKAAPDLPPLDLCIMNPPFVRGQKDNLSYSFLPQAERERVHRRINDIAKRKGFSCDKGLGSAFISLACHKRSIGAFVKEGGRIAAILPLTFAAGMGNAWSNARKKIEKDFNLETIVASRDPSRPNFSENTALQECFFVARKRKKREKKTDNALFVVLYKNPTNTDTALAINRAIMTSCNNGKKMGYLYASQNGAKNTAKEALGQFAVLPYRGKPAWRGFSFAELKMAVAAENFLQKGTLLPYAKGKLNLCKLGTLATFGGATLDLRINHEDFKSLDVAKHKTQYAGYYPGYHKHKSGISHKDESHIAEKPHCYLLPIPGREKWTDNHFAKAGRVVINHSFRFNTARRLAVLVSEPVQASHYWPIKLNNEDEDKLKTLALWLNSTPALLLIANSAQSTHGAKVGFSQKAAGELMVPDLDNIDGDKLKKAAAVFDTIAEGVGLLPLPQMAIDEERAKIDKVFSDMFSLGDLSSLREALAAEPIISGV